MKLFILGLFILAGGIGTLVFGITGITESTYIQRLLAGKDYTIVIGIGAALSVLGVGMLIGSIIWKRKQ